MRWKITKKRQMQPTSNRWKSNEELRAHQAKVLEVIDKYAYV